MTSPHPGPPLNGYSTAVFAVAAPTLIIHTVDPYEKYPKEVREEDIPRIRLANDSQINLSQSLYLCTIFADRAIPTFKVFPFLISTP